MRRRRKRGVIVQCFSKIIRRGRGTYVAAQCSLIRRQGVSAELAVCGGVHWSSAVAEIRDLDAVPLNIHLHYLLIPNTKAIFICLEIDCSDSSKFLPSVVLSMVILICNAKYVFQRLKSCLRKILLTSTRPNGGLLRGTLG